MTESKCKKSLVFSAVFLLCFARVYRTSALCLKSPSDKLVFYSSVGNHENKRKFQFFLSQLFCALALGSNVFFWR